MDIIQLNNFLDYKKNFNPDPQDIVDKIISKAKKYLKNDNVESEIQRTYEFTKKAHEWQLRLSGEPYIIHPVEATLILMELKPDLASIQTCLLHDVLEDCDVTPEEIEKEFWPEILSLCEWLVKVSKVRYKWEDRQLETIKKTFLAMAKDLRVIFVKLADRMHNMQTLNFHPEVEKRIKIANETMKIYVQIAKRLWLYHFQVKLENACFKVLHPDDFDKINNYLIKWFASTDKHIKRWTNTITRMLEKEWLTNFSVKWRIKSPYRIREKMKFKYQTSEISNIFDLLAFRVITEDIEDCYTTLGIIHKYYTPLIKKIKDYIAVPKFNWYKSIHTTILWMFKFPVEIQIRTKEMDAIAEYWVAAHYAYSDIDSPNQVNKKQAEWMRKLQELVNAYTESESKDEFKDQMNIELLNKESFVYTPKWDIIELPKWSTVLDFAFYVHTEIGLRFKNAIVNWEIVPITYVPNTWDVVQINTFRYRYTANKYRASILKTPSAKNRLQRYLKSENMDLLIEQSTKNLNQKLKEYWLPFLNSKDDIISTIYEKKDLQKKLLDALQIKWIYSEIIKSAYPEKYKSIKTQTTKQRIANVIWSKNRGIIIDDDKLLNYTLCPECNPQYPHKIIAKTGRTWIKIHNIKCKALKTVHPENLLEAHREWEPSQNYSVITTILADKDVNIIKFLEAFMKINIEINSFSIKSDTDESKKIIKITRWISNPSQNNMIRDEIKKFWNSVKVLKREFE